MTLALDALTAEDCEQVRIWRNRDTSGLRTVMPLTREQQQEFYREIVCDRQSAHRYWAVRDESARLVACVGLTNIDWINGHAEISLIVAESGNGYGRATVDLVLDEAFDRLGLRCVWGECYSTNTRVVTFWRQVADAHHGDCTRWPCRKFWRGVLYDSLLFTIPSPRMNIPRVTAVLS